MAEILKFVEKLILQLGWKRVLLIVAIVLGLSWAIAYVTAEPGSVVSIAWGLASFTKPAGGPEAPTTTAGIAPSGLGERGGGADAADPEAPPARPPLRIETQRASSADDARAIVERLRKGRRSLEKFEDGLPVLDLPRNLYFFVKVVDLTASDRGMALAPDARAVRKPRAGTAYQMQFADDGEPCILLFTAESDAVEISALDGLQPHDVVVASRWQGQMPVVGVVPLQRITRCVRQAKEGDDDEPITLLHLTIR